MACPDFETLLREGPTGHAAHCDDCAVLLEAFADVDSSLAAAFHGVAAPPGMASAVQMRIAGEQARRRPSVVPEVLDFIGWAAILALFAVLAQRFLPPILF
ncbi:MAG TPA: hypothetical protein VLW65_12280 [Bryobacteraceae bacterium]|nr:hypothetical protein [Bryobacteraceae bacterium]